MLEYHFKNIEFFYSPPDNISGNNYIISGEEYNHLKKVLRKSVGDNIFIVDGNNYIYNCTITEIKKDFVITKINNINLHKNELDLNIHLAVGLLKNPSRYDFIIEKATELGVKKITPFNSQYTIANNPKIERWKNIAISAMKQSQRALLPEIEECKKFDEILDLKADLKLIADIESEDLQINNKDSLKDILIIIGPEGGFSDIEISKAISSGFKKFKLSNTRLRTETAAIISIPYILHTLNKL